jgi:hypothetical protein
VCVLSLLHLTKNIKRLKIAAPERDVILQFDVFLAAITQICSAGVCVHRYYLCFVAACQIMRGDKIKATLGCKIIAAG